MKKKNHRFPCPLQIYWIWDSAKKSRLLKCFPHNDAVSPHSLMQPFHQYGLKLLYFILHWCNMFVISLLSNFKIIACIRTFWDNARHPEGWLFHVSPWSQESIFLSYTLNVLIYLKFFHFKISAWHPLDPRWNLYKHTHEAGIFLLLARTYIFTWSYYYFRKYKNIFILPSVVPYKSGQRRVCLGWGQQNCFTSALFDY